MPLPKKLNCQDVDSIFQNFIGGATVKAIAEDLDVTRLTVTRVLRKETYQDCTEAHAKLPENFFETVDERMKANQRRSRGQGKKVNS